MKKAPEECYLDVVVEKPKPSGTERCDLHSYAEEPDPSTEWDANKENDGGHASPPSPPPSDDDRGRSGGKVYVSASSGHDREVSAVKKSAGPGRPSTQPRATRVPPASTDIDISEQPSLNLPAGELTQYLSDLRGSSSRSASCRVTTTHWWPRSNLGMHTPTVWWDPRTVPGLSAPDTSRRPGGSRCAAGSS